MRRKLLLLWKSFVNINQDDLMPRKINNKALKTNLVSGIDMKTPMR